MPERLSSWVTLVLLVSFHNQLRAESWLIFCETGIGAIFFAEHTRTLFPELGEGDEEEFNLIASLTPSKQTHHLFPLCAYD